MTAVEIARARLAHATARRATPKRRTATTSPRHDDSGAQSSLEEASESALARSMTATADALPDDIGALRALILVERAERAQFAERIESLERLNTKLEYIVAELRRAHFGRKSERITDEQLTLALDELETAAAKAEAEAEKADPERPAGPARGPAPMK
jgi:Transposase C of IS166 homeodomain